MTLCVENSRLADAKPEVQRISNVPAALADWLHSNQTIHFPETVMLLKRLRVLANRKY